jgi:hypothetical protein
MLGREVNSPVIGSRVTLELYRTVADLATFCKGRAVRRASVGRLEGVARERRAANDIMGLSKESVVVRVTDPRTRALLSI